MTRVCSNCGQTVKDTAKFCKYCGRPLTSPVTGPRAPTVPQVRRAAPPSAKAPVPKPVTEVPSEVLGQLEMRAELMQLEEKEKELVEELERLEGELEKGDRSIADLEKEIKPLQKRIKTLKTQEKQIKKKVKGFPFERASKERLHSSERLEKLEELKQSGKVRESVYRRLKEEYETTQRKADLEFQEQIGLAREWLALLKAQYTAARDELSLLEARHSVGEVKDTAYKSQKAKLNKRGKTLGGQVEVLESILQEV